MTICLTCRDERGNIEGLVRAIPQLSARQEILFVEGHSRDGTREEILRCIERYPQRNVRLVVQPGIGQGDAIRAGFSAAKGEIVLLLEADMTSPPEDLSAVYGAMCRHEADYIHCSRFTRPMSARCMPLLNQIGNRVFALWFGWLLRQPITDVLGGIKAIRKCDFDRLVLHWGQWGVVDPFGDFELLLGATRLGLRVAQMPMQYRPRHYGASKTRPFVHGALLCRIAFRALLGTRR